MASLINFRTFFLKCTSLLLMHLLLTKSVLLALMQSVLRLAADSQNLCGRPLTTRMCTCKPFVPLHGGVCNTISFGLENRRDTYISKRYISCHLPALQFCTG